MASASSLNRTARVWDMHGNEVGNYVVNCELIDVEFFPEDHHLILACGDGTVKIINWQTGCLVDTWVGHDDQCVGTNILPRSRKIISAGQCDPIKLWSRRETGEDISSETGCSYSLERTLGRSTV